MTTRREQLKRAAVRTGTMACVLGAGTLGLLKRDPLGSAWEARKILLRKMLRQEFHQGLSYYVGGQGPPVVFIHGLSDYGGSWMETIALMRERCRVIVIELPGHGDSIEPQEQTMAGVLRGVETLLDLLIPAHQKAILVGNSMGGWAVLHYALVRPDRVAHKVLINSAGHAYEPDRELLVPTSRASMMAKLETLMGPDRMPPPLPGVFIDALMTLATPFQNELISGITREDFLSPEDFKTLALRALPTTILWGEHDQIFPQEYAEEFFALFPHATIVERANWGHGAHMSHPGELATHLDFIVGPYARSWRVA